MIFYGGHTGGSVVVEKDMVHKWSDSDSDKEIGEGGTGTKGEDKWGRSTGDRQDLRRGTKGGVKQGSLMAGDRWDLWK